MEEFSGVFFPILVKFVCWANAFLSPETLTIKLGSNEIQHPEKKPERIKSNKHIVCVHDIFIQMTSTKKCFVAKNQFESFALIYR